MRRPKLCIWIVLLAIATVALQTTRAKAQADGQGPDQDQAQDQGQDQDQVQDPPSRVARLSYSEGSVSFRPAGEDDWVTAVPNRPMVTGDDLWADQDSRAEVHVGSAAIRMGAQTGITFLTLDDHTTQIRLAQGSLILRVRHVDDDDTYEIDTPNLAFTLLQPGEYRIDVSADGSQTITTVWHGRGRVTGGGFTYSVVANQSATFTGSDHPDYDLEQIPQRDEFDSWAFFRDQREDQADSANYVSREMTGYEDLDENGDWSYVPGYGECWRPHAVAVDWAPYRYGHWAWVGPWGWTWVEDEPWGFAPFHYGRWAYVNSGWFWVPGPVVVRPVWAPALVAFVGGRPGSHFSAGGGMGWFPLGPGEVYVPGYRVSRAYVNNVNVTNTTVSVERVTNVYTTVVVNKTTVNNVTYVNQRVTNGVTVVSHDAFVNARPVSQNIMRVDAREVVAAPVGHIVAAEPVRASVVGIGRPVSVRPPAAVISRTVVAVKTPAPTPHSFAQRQAEAGGHLSQETLVRLAGPPSTQHPPATQQIKLQPVQQAVQQPGAVKVQAHMQPRTLEQQGSSTTAESHDSQPAERNGQPMNRTQEVNRNPAPQPPQAQPHPLVRTAPPVQERNAQQEKQQADKFNTWQQQRPPAPAPATQQRQPPPQSPKPVKPPKK